MSEVPLYRVRFRRPICSREFLCSENFSMQIGRRTRTRQAHLGCLVVGVAEAAESSTFIHATGYEPHRSVRTDRALGVVQTHQPSGWDQIPIFEALDLYTGPRRNPAHLWYKSTGSKKTRWSYSDGWWTGGCVGVCSGGHRQSGGGSCLLPGQQGSETPDPRPLPTKRFKTFVIPRTRVCTSTSTSTYEETT